MHDKNIDIISKLLFGCHTGTFVETALRSMGGYHFCDERDE
jgi:hypothetical protein